ncbi:MAG: hypothetical protein K2J80_12125 [Oscillospiraceae bacterium]|nr:hypothetical protein [Oscillospiraceae bacterium]
MKTYEEMARDVLKRRDEELLKMPQTTYNAPPEVVYPAVSKKRGLVPKIVIPCTAAVTAAAVGICIWNKIPHRGRYINQLIASDEPLTDQEKLDFIYEAFKSHKYEDQIIPVTFESVYKGGRTEININKAEVKDVYPYYEYNSIPPNMPKDEDFISIADEEINSYYGMEFDRLSTVFTDWKSEHKPFGYYNRDIETSHMVEHLVHGYYSHNSIAYTTEGGIEFAVSARFNKFTAAVENAKSSVINGFDAMIYQFPSGGFVVDIDMGAIVRIHADRVHKDTLIKIIDAYTKPRSELTKVSFEEINILDEMPNFLRENDPFAAESTDGCEIKNIDAEYVNKYYNMEFDRLGKLHKDWYEEGKDDLKIYFRFEDTLVKDVCEINTLYYTTPNYSDIYVRANIGYIPEPETDFYDVSYVNGHYAVIYRGGRIGYDDKIYPNNDAKFGAMVEFGGTVVNITSAGLSEEEFLTVLDEYTK